MSRNASDLDYTRFKGTPAEFQMLHNRNPDAHGAVPSNAVTGSSDDESVHSSPSSHSSDSDYSPPKKETKREVLKNTLGIKPKDENSAGSVIAGAGGSAYSGEIKSEGGSSGGSGKGLLRNIISQAASNMGSRSPVRNVTPDNSSQVKSASGMGESDDNDDSADIQAEDNGSAGVGKGDRANIQAEDNDDNDDSADIQAEDNGSAGVGNHSKRPPRKRKLSQVRGQIEHPEFASSFLTYPQCTRNKDSGCPNLGIVFSNGGGSKCQHADNSIFGCMRIIVKIPNSDAGYVYEGSGAGVVCLGHCMQKNSNGTACSQYITNAECYKCLDAKQSYRRKNNLPPESIESVSEGIINYDNVLMDAIQKSPWAILFFIIAYYAGFDMLVPTIMEGSGVDFYRILNESGVFKKFTGARGDKNKLSLDDDSMLLISARSALQLFLPIINVHNMSVLTKSLESMLSCKVETRKGNEFDRFFECVRTPKLEEGDRGIELKTENLSSNANPLDNIKMIPLDALKCNIVSTVCKLYSDREILKVKSYLTNGMTNPNERRKAGMDKEKCEAYKKAVMEYINKQWTS